MKRPTLFELVLRVVVMSLSTQRQIGSTGQGQYTRATPEWNQPVKPFRIIGNIYYVGASEVSSFLITTPKGHTLDLVTKVGTPAKVIHRLVVVAIPQANSSSTGFGMIPA